MDCLAPSPANGRGKKITKYTASPMNTSASSYYFYSNRSVIRWRVETRPALTGEVKHCNKVAHRARRHKQVPDKMAVAQAVVGRKKADAKGVKQAASH